MRESEVRSLVRKEVEEWLELRKYSYDALKQKIEAASSGPIGVGVCGRCGGTVVAQWNHISYIKSAGVPRCSSCKAEPLPLAMAERRKEGKE